MSSVKEETNKEALLECIKMGSELQYEEIVLKKDKLPVNINVDLLCKALTAGILKLVVARDEGKVVGYFVNIVEVDWLTSTLVANELAIFIHPEHRSLSTFSKMLKAQEALVKKLGVKVQNLEFQKGHSTRLPLAFGYREVGTVFEKYLGE